ncbi:DUF3105 domain-containing protein [Actinophytocola oryzae]|uniref:Uncharacterized protein DUF3105 n=1 Tax=Actinophytocola oryzae TaxID=502181 RepID=A0A4V3FU57_9PSEU|nr:DUF3105 domain-containing protein [Actinophytocola oryzae]TDV53971.1 uncharacterized protein DUF3105 [Actinophytocola oryzae]
MASGTKSKGANTPKGKSGSVNKARRSSAVGSARKAKPWGMIIGLIAIVALAAGVFTYALMTVHDKEKWVVSEDNQDPSTNIEGVFREKYEAGQHVQATQRVAYDHSPPLGGPHDGVWADCQGTVYPKAVRTENMVHALEHGSVWIAYNPDKIKGKDLNALRAKVEGQPYMLMSPWPNLDKPISLQSWGHQLKLSKADDPRIDEFIKSLRENQYQNPEPGGRCDTQDTGFDVTNPPPFVAEKPDPKDPNTVTMDGKGAQDAAAEEQSGMSPTGGATPPASDGATPPASDGATPPASDGASAPATQPSQ